MKIKGVLLIGWIIACVPVFSQPVMHFEKSLHDFGTIKETDGPVAYNFQFTNTGNAPVLIKSVEASCGCTSPEWSRQPVLPGKTGFIKATFDPKDRPSFFNKSITVSSNAKNAQIELEIKGTVEARTRTILDEYPYELPSGLRLPYDHISLLKAKKGEVKTATYGVYNNSGKTAAVSFPDLPPHIRISIDPQQIDVKKTATLKASYNTGQHGEYGLNEEIVTMLVDGKKYPLRVSVTIEEDFSQTDRAHAPGITVDKKYINFGQATGDRQASFLYKITNSGKAPLKIHRIYTNDKRVTAEISVRELKPGASADVKVMTVRGAEPGKVACMISIITNSPANPDTGLRFYGEIK